MKIISMSFYEIFSLAPYAFLLLGGVKWQQQK